MGGKTLSERDPHLPVMPHCPSGPTYHSPFPPALSPPPSPSVSVSLSLSLSRCLSILLSLSIKVSEFEFSLSLSIHRPYRSGGRAGRYLFTRRAHSSRPGACSFSPLWVLISTPRVLHVLFLRSSRLPRIFRPICFCGVVTGRGAKSAIRVLRRGPHVVRRCLIALHLPDRKVRPPRRGPLSGLPRCLLK